MSAERPTSAEKIALAKSVLKRLEDQTDSPQEVSSRLLYLYLINAETASEILPSVPESVMDGLVDFASSTPTTDAGWSRFQIRSHGCFPLGKPMPQSAFRKQSWDEILDCRACAESIRSYLQEQGRILIPQPRRVKISLREALDRTARTEAYNEAIAEFILKWRQKEYPDGRTFWFDGDKAVVPFGATTAAYFRRSELAQALFTSNLWQFTDSQPPRWAKILLTEHLPAPYDFEPSLVHRPVPCVTVIRREPFEFPWHTELNEFNEPEFSYDKLIEAIESGDSFTVPGIDQCDALCRALLVARIQHPEMEPTSWHHR